MCSHVAMMHYALHESKCLLHQPLGYRRCMQTPNERLRILRLKRYESASEAAQAIGVSPSTYIQHENGIRGSGSLPRKAAERYATFFKVSLDWLLTGRGEGPMDDPEPTVDELEQMLREAIRELEAGVTYGEWPRYVAPSLHEQLALYRAGGGVRGNPAEATAPDRPAQSPAATRPAERA
jgi:transcriptional regulator with XRE-family HTH domain